MPIHYQRALDIKRILISNRYYNQFDAKIEKLNSISNYIDSSSIFDLIV